MISEDTQILQDEPVPVLSPLLTASADVSHEQDEIARVDKTNPVVLREKTSPPTEGG